jgi:curved DNA-binding protein CbpA
MSAPVAGKFQDHYSVLGIDPKADDDAILKAYTRLAEKYHPKNRETGNQEQFDAVALAYEVLSDGFLRQQFDQIKGVTAQSDEPKFSGLSFFDDLGRDVDLRAAVLCILYDRRRSKPQTPGLSVRNLEAMLDVTTDELFLALWYLKQRNLALSDDKSKLQITVEGIDFLERRKPAPEMVLPLIKPSAMLTPPADPEAAAATESGSVMDRLSRALART